MVVVLSACMCVIVLCLLDGWSCDEIIGRFRGATDILRSSKICSIIFEMYLYFLVDFTAVTSHFCLFQVFSLINNISFFV